MPAIKREAVYASIRSQLMTDPQRGTILLLNLLKLFADRKDDAEFVKELADLASDLASVESPYAQSPLFAQPMPMPMMPPSGYMQAGTSIPVPSIADFGGGEPSAMKAAYAQAKAVRQPEEQKEIVPDALSALSQMGEDTTQFQKKNTEPDIEGYEEYVPPKRKKKN